VSHFVTVCQHGHTHATCRCPGPNKQVRTIECPWPSRVPAEPLLPAEALHIPLSLCPLPMDWTDAEWTRLMQEMAPSANLEQAMRRVAQWRLAEPPDRHVHEFLAAWHEAVGHYEVCRCGQTQGVGT
jgi:hypothetical protein